MTAPHLPPVDSRVSTRSLDPGGIALEWWRHLNDAGRGDPATLARLRRARTALEVLSVPAAVALARRLGAVRSACDSRTRDALDLTRVLAHVREHDPRQHPMRALGWRSFPGSRTEGEAGDDRPKLAEARFRRLLQSGTTGEHVTSFVRLIALLGRKAKIDDLARDFLDWNHSAYGPRVRERWAFLYYAADMAEPSRREGAFTSDHEEGEP